MSNRRSWDGTRYNAGRMLNKDRIGAALKLSSARLFDIQCLFVFLIFGFGNAKIIPRKKFHDVVSGLMTLSIRIEVNS